MAKNKIVYGGNTLIDLTDTTATASDVAQGKYFYNNAGVRTEGTATGGGSLSSAEVKDINFFDYDGTCLYSYTFAEWASVTELPPNPSHDELTAQGWNWTKSEIDTQISHMPECPVQVGQHYVTTSGKTEIDFWLSEEMRSPYLGLGINGSISVDWGDGSPAQTITATNLANNTNTQHEYAQGGFYTIKISRVSGSFNICGTNGSNRKSLLNNNSGTDTRNIIYENAISEIRVGDLGTNGGFGIRSCPPMVKKINIPLGAKMNNQSFRNSALQCVVIPKTFTNQTDIISGAGSLETVCYPPTATIITLYTCAKLKNVTFPYQAVLTKGVVGNSYYAVSGCQSLNKSFISNANTEIQGQCFRYNYSLTKITIPNTITSILSLAFGDCFNLIEIYMKPTVPPTLDSTSFSNVPSSCVIYVPYSADHSVLNAYKTATNWSTYASQIVEETL